MTSVAATPRTRAANVPPWRLEEESTPFRSAMSMLTFYGNRAGRTLSATERRKLNAAKEELRKLYGKRSSTPRSAAKKAKSRRSARGARKKATAKTARRKQRRS